MNIGEIERGVLSIDPGERNLGMTLIAESKIGSIPKKILKQFDNEQKYQLSVKLKSHILWNYKILWVGVFDLKQSGSTHQNVLNQLKLVLARNNVLRQVLKNKNIHVAIENQEGYKLNAYKIQGFMRPNWISGYISGWFGSHGLNVSIIHKRQKWRWSFITTLANKKWVDFSVKSTKIQKLMKSISSHHNNLKSISSKKQLIKLKKSLKNQEENKKRDFRKKITTVYCCRLLQMIGDKDTNLPIKAFDNKFKHGIKNHFCDAILIGLHYLSTTKPHEKITKKEINLLNTVYHSTETATANLI
jgi:hypothetical protein